MRCSSCDQDKICSEFYRNRAMKSGYHNQCKACHNASREKWAAAHPDVERAGHRRRGKRQKLLGWPNQKAYYSALGKDGRRKKYVLWKYGPKAAELDQTQTRCAVCAGPLEMKSIDHCHECSEVRGVLCRKCNAAIGLLGDSPELLQAALSYLVGHECPKERADGTRS